MTKLNLIDYTMIIYQYDRRTRSGIREINRYEYPQKDSKWMAEEVRELYSTVYPLNKFLIDIRETYVSRKNFMTGEEFKERFDTPYTCSPSSETYWST